MNDVAAIGGRGVSMRAVITDLLWIGNAVEARDISGVLKRGITAVVDIALEEKPICFPREIAYCRMPLVDGAGNPPELLNGAVGIAFQFAIADRQTLICCGAGMSRAPAVAAHVLSRLRGIPAEDALLQIAAQGPHDISPLFWGELCKAVPG